ncbi:MAG: hypothetical protein LC098_08225 [Burkholderiales bacterium]|nr:hypothetical protein [Burkholderiales bacterium]
MNYPTRRTLKSLEALRLPELQAKYAELVGEKTRSPNKKHLLSKIAQALEAREQANAKPTLQTPATPEPVAKVKLTKLSVPELQALHREIIGRETTSTDSAYLVWRVRQAQKGRIRVGPIERRAPGEAADVKVLPLRMTAAEAEAMDEAWRRLGFKSRTAMIRKAIGAMLA